MNPAAEIDQVRPRSWKRRHGPDGVHFFDRMTGMNVLVDEIAPPRASWDAAPRYVSFALTNACELSCSYCYAPKRGARLDRGALLGWLRELDDNGCLGVGFGGGEPTLYPGFAELCREAHDTTRLAITFTTHGHRMTPDLAATIRGAVQFIRVSVDGVGATYELLRGRPFDDLRRRIEDIASICPFGINVVVNAATVGDLDDLANFTAQVGASELLLLPEQSAPGTTGITGADEARMRSWIRDYRGSVRLSISQAGAESSLALADPFISSTPLESHAHVDAFGRMAANAFGETYITIDGSLLSAFAQLEELA